MIYCRIEDGVVVQRAVFEGSMPEGWADPAHAWVAEETAQVGWSYANGEFAAPPPPSLPKPPVTVSSIKTEAQRRIIVTTGASDLMSCVIKQLNAQMRANELNDKRIGGEALTEAELAEAATLRALAARIKAIRAASNVLELSLPNDYENDAHWA